MTRCKQRHGDEMPVPDEGLMQGVEREGNPKVFLDVQ